MAQTQAMLTTVDNPYNPFTQFEEWYSFDMAKGYDSSGKVARLMDTSSDLTDEEELLTTEQAIDIIIKNDFLNIFRKVFMTDDDAKDLDIET